MMVPSSVHIMEYFALPTATADNREISAWSSASAACGPLTRTSPMWERSKMPASVRTALCSSSSLPYLRGISQPPKSVKRAPSSSWTSCNAVFCGVDDPAPDPVASWSVTSRSPVNIAGVSAAVCGIGAGVGAYLSRLLNSSSVMAKSSKGGHEHATWRSP